MKLRLILLAALCVTFSGCTSKPPTPTSAQLLSLVENEVKKEHPKSTVTLTGLEPLGSMGEFLMVKFGCTDYSTKDAKGNMVTYPSAEGFSRSSLIRRRSDGNSPSQLLQTSLQ